MTAISSPLTVLSLLLLGCALLIGCALLNPPRSGAALFFFGAGSAVGGAAMCLSIQLVLS